MYIFVINLGLIFESLSLSLYPHICIRVSFINHGRSEWESAENSGKSSLFENDKCEVRNEEEISGLEIIYTVREDRDDVIHGAR